METISASKWRAVAIYLRQLRLDAKVTKADLAEWLGWDKSQIDRLESYPDGLELVQVIDFAQALEADPNRVLSECKEILRCS